MNVLRTAALSDIPAITRIYGDAVRLGTASFEIDPPDAAEMTARMRVLVDGGFPYLVAEMDGAVRGYAYAGPYRARPAYRFSVEDSIYIAADAQRRGIGRALLARLLAESAGRGYRQMIAVIGDSANTSSIELHRLAGFFPVGTLRDVGYKFDRWLDSVIMQYSFPADARPAP